MIYFNNTNPSQKYGEIKMEKNNFINMTFMLIVGLIWFSNCYAQDTNSITLQPGPECNDTYVCDCLPNANNPNGPITKLYQGQYGTCFDRFLIQWDLSSLPKNITITRAIMELKCSTITGTLSGQMVYYRITGNWGETQVTYATLPSYTNEDSVAMGWPTVGQWHAVDITKFVQKWIQDTASNYGVYGHCAGTTGQGVVGFSSSDASSNRPKLVITYATTTGIHFGQSQPLKFQLYQNYPNPFNPTSKIYYSISRGVFVSLKVYDISGKVVASLVQQKQNPGNYEITFNGSHLTSGIYLYRLQAGSFCDVKKMILVK
jgi:hypothetical protein